MGSDSDIVLGPAVNFLLTPSTQQSIRSMWAGCDLGFSLSLCVCMWLKVLQSRAESRRETLYSWSEDRCLCNSAHGSKGKFLFLCPSSSDCVSESCTGYSSLLLPVSHTSWMAPWDGKGQKWCLGLPKSLLMFGNRWCVDIGWCRLLFLLLPVRFLEASFLF